MNYPIAPNGIFTTIQGEGLRAGEPMIFVRLAGCSIGCALCDTDYSVAVRLSVGDIIAEIQARQIGQRPLKTVWLTGGEPLDHDLMPLLEELRQLGLEVCIATSGHKEVSNDVFYRLGCWMSVSPHVPSEWKLLAGHELKIVPGLAGFGIADFIAVMDSRAHAFRSKWVIPCDGKPETVQECRDFVLANRGWLMGGQLHKQWGLP